MNNTISQLYHIIRVWYNVILLYKYYIHIVPYYYTITHRIPVCYIW